MSTPISPSLVYRQVSFTEDAFAYLKRLQKEYCLLTGIWMTNSECLSVVLDEHRAIQTEALDRNEADYLAEVMAMLKDKIAAQVAAKEVQ